MSWVGYLNMYLFQFLFFRLGYCTEKGRKCKFVILFPVFPFTGWKNNYWPKKRINIKLYKNVQRVWEKIDNSDLNELLKKATKEQEE